MEGPKLYQANILKHYFSRSQANFTELLDENSVGVEEASEDKEGLTCTTDLEDE